MNKPSDKVISSTKEFEKLAEAGQKDYYLLRLFVSGSTDMSANAIINIKNICEENLKGRYNLEIIDLYQNPGLAIGEQIIAAPTLVKKLPLPLRRIIGNLTSKDKVLAGLGIKVIKGP